MQTSEGLFCIRKKQLSDPPLPPSRPPPGLEAEDDKFTVQVRRCNEKQFNVISKTVEV